MFGRGAGKERNAYLGALLDACSGGVAVIDAGGIVRDETGPFCGLLPGGGSLTGRNLAEVVHPDDAPKALALLADAGAEHGGVAWPRPIRWRIGHDESCMIEIEALVHNLLEDPVVQGLVLHVRNASERAMEERLKRALFRDALTGLGNRLSLFDRVQVALLGEGPRSLVAVLFLDLDDFKTVNDSLGHAAGDELLIATAERLRSTVRPLDTAARLGGDEFGVVLEALEHPDQAGEVAKRIIEAFRVPFTVAGAQIQVHTSIGIALSRSAEPATGTEARQHNPTELVRNADVAMYAAKERGKGRFEYFSAGMRDGALARLKLRNELQHASDENEFFLQYQPVVDLATGRITAAEALLRWRHRERGLISPGQFVALAEETGLMDTIGRWVLREACGEARRWHDRGRPIRVNVNLSAHQLDQPGLADEIAATLARAGLAPGYLVIEITEQIFMEHSERITGNLRSLRELGVRLALDDFGTGYSSLSYLERFPVDYLKIDQSFIEAMGDQRQKPALARAVIEIAHSLDLQVVAEGIETADQLHQLRAMRCDYGQGFLFAKPLDAYGMSRFLSLQRVGAVTASAHDAACPDAPAPVDPFGESGAETVPELGALRLA